MSGELFPLGISEITMGRDCMFKLRTQDFRIREAFISTVRPLVLASNLILMAHVELGKVTSDAPICISIPHLRPVHSLNSQSSLQVAGGKVRVLPHIALLAYKPILQKMVLITTELNLRLRFEMTKFHEILTIMLFEELVDVRLRFRREVHARRADGSNHTEQGLKPLRARGQARI